MMTTMNGFQQENQVHVMLPIMMISKVAECFVKCYVVGNCIMMIVMVVLSLMIHRFGSRIDFDALTRDSSCGEQYPDSMGDCREDSLENGTDNACKCIRKS